MEFLQNNPMLSSLFVMAVLGCSCEGTCRAGQFAVDDSLCCPLCLEGWFVKVNCSRPSHNITKGNQCAQCKTCGNGWKMISQCTEFSDTMCEKEVPSTPTTVVTPVMMPNATVFVGELALYITASVVVVLIVVASVCKWYTTRKSPEDPAKEPLKIQHITV